VNADRRQTGKMCLALLHECSEIGEISDDSHVALKETLAHLTQQEFWQLKSQSKWEGQNASTDKQLAIARVALPALEEAVKALEKDDFETVITQLELAVNTDGEALKKRLRKARGVS
jgi:hypothetical protein